VDEDRTAIRSTGQLAPLNRPDQRNDASHQGQQVNEATQRERRGQSDAPEKQKYDERRPQHAVLRAFEFTPTVADCVPAQSAAKSAFLPSHG
jgi:hypothetical protein